MLQVEDEQVEIGAAQLARLAARQHGDHQAVAQHAEARKGGRTPPA